MGESSLFPESFFTDPAEVRLVVVEILSVVAVLVLLALSPVVAPVSPLLMFCIPLSMELLRLIVEEDSSCAPREAEEEE